MNTLIHTQSARDFKRMSLLSCAAILGLFAATQYVSADTLLSDNFSGTAGVGIGGNAPTINNINSAVWATSQSDPLYGAVYTGSGSGTFGATTTNQFITLDTGSYAANNPGVYTLSLTINNSDTSGNDWYGFGWSALPAVEPSPYTIASSGTYNAGYGWLLLRGNGELRVYGGPGASGTVLYTSGAGAYTATSVILSLVLDTTGANYTLDAYANSVQLDLNGASAGDTFTFATNPTADQLQYVGISSAATSPSVNETFSDFLLTGPTVVPEPSTLALGVIGGGLLLIWRRKLAVK